MALGSNPVQTIYIFKSVNDTFRMCNCIVKKQKLKMAKKRSDLPLFKRRWIIGYFVTFETLSQAVWPDWGIFDCFCWQIFFHKYPKYLMTLWAILKYITFRVKTIVAHFWKYLGYFLFQHMVTLVPLEVTGLELSVEFCFRYRPRNGPLLIPSLLVTKMTSQQPFAVRKS